MSEYDSISCSETESVGSVSESLSGSESFSSIAEALEAMREQLEVFGAGVEGLHKGVKQMEAPVTSVAVGSFVQPRFLESAPFRKERFALKEEARRCLGLEKETAKFSSICTALRAYCFQHKLVDPTGVIHLNEELKTVLCFDTDTTTFLGLLMHIETIVQ
jgi:hypothetical protein